MKGWYDMEYQCADRLRHFKTGIFTAMDEKKAALIKAGVNVTNLSVGTPDFRPPEHIIKAVEEAGEYIQAIAKYIDNPDNVNKNALLGEMADVMITFNQLKTMTDISDVALFQMVDFKTRKLAKLLNLEE